MSEDQAELSKLPIFIEWLFIAIFIAFWISWIHRLWASKPGKERKKAKKWSWIVGTEFVLGEKDRCSFEFWSFHLAELQFPSPATGNGLPSLQAGHNEAFMIINWNNSNYVMWTVDSIAQENRSFYFFSAILRPWYLWRVLCVSPPSLGSKIHDNKEWSFPQAFHPEVHLAFNGHWTGLGRWLTSLLPRCSSEGGLCLWKWSEVERFVRLSDKTDVA